METKEAIRYINIMNEALFEAYLIGTKYITNTEEYKENIGKIIALLERGEKFEEMWKDVAKKFAHVTDEHGRNIRGIFEIYEQEYFPEEIE